MAAATATSRSRGSLFFTLGASIVLIVGFDLTLGQQDHRFRINVFDDYQQQQQQPDYQDYQADQGQRYQGDQRQVQNYQGDQQQIQDYQDQGQIQDYQDQRQNQRYRVDQHPVQNYQADQHQVQNFQADQHQVQNYQVDQHPVQNFQANQHQVQNYQTDQHQVQKYRPDQYQKQYQQQFEATFKSQYVKPTAPPKKKPKKEGQDFSKIPGVPGVDFPIYHAIPKTSFSCAQVPYLPGMYANVETGCQVYHVCHDGREGEQGASFLCSNGTLFNQHEFACDWWYNVKCHDSFRLYSLNGDATTNPFVPKAKQEEILKGREDEDRFKIAVF